MRRLFVALALLLGPLAAAVRVYPTSPTLSRALPGAIVTHVFRVEGGGGPYTPVFTSSAGFPILSRPRPLRPPAYLPVTERVPEDALEGTTDVLTVTVDGARAEVRTRVGFRPGLGLRAPERVIFVPPLKLVRVEVENRGNGPDGFLLRLLGEKEVLEAHRLELAPGERRALLLGLPRTGSYRLVLRELRAGKEAEKTIVARPPERGPLAPLRLTGQAALGYAWPGNGAAASFSLAGPLSDYLSLRAYGAASRPGTGLFSFDLFGEGWSAGADLGPRVAGRLALWEGTTAVRLSAGSGPWARAELAFAGAGARHRWAVSAAPDLRLDLSGAGAPTDRLSFGYGLSVAGGGASGALSLGLRRKSLHLALNYGGDYAPPDPYAQRFSLGLSDTWGSAGASAALKGGALADWSLAAASTGKQLFGPRAPPSSLGLEATPEHLAFSGQARLQAAPELDLALDAAYRWRGDAFADAELRLDLPPPFGELVAGAKLDAGRVSGYLEADAERPLEDARLALSGRLAYPWEASELGGRLHLGGSARYLEVGLRARPFVPSASFELSAQTPVGPGLLALSATARLPEGSYALSLGARAPILISVPDAVAELFGGRKVATVLGALRPDAPVERLAGIRVVAGPYQAETDAAGRFALKLPPGRWTLRLVQDSLPVTLVSEKPEITLTLRAKETRRVVFPLSVRARLAGRVEVRIEKGCKPPRLRFALEVEDAAGRKAALYTEPDGRFDLPGLRPGVYTVRLLKDFLPPGYRALIDAVRVRLEPGKTARVVLVVRAPPRKVYRHGKVRILAVRPEVGAAPPGAVPLVEAELKGKPDRLLVRYRGRVLGLLLPTQRSGLWRGRVAIPRDARGPLPLELVALAGGRELVRFPFYLAADPRAPWGVVRTLPVVRRGQKGVPVFAHLYAPAVSATLRIGEKAYPLKGAGADWRGSFDVPPTAAKRLRLVLEARLAGGREVRLTRYLLVR